MNMHDAVKAANGGRIYRKATGQVIRFKSGKRPEKNNSNIFPTLEDVMANDWFPVRPGSERAHETLIVN